MNVEEEAKEAGALTVLIERLVGAHGPIVQCAALMSNTICLAGKELGKEHPITKRAIRVFAEMAVEMKAGGK